VKAMSVVLSKRQTSEESIKRRGGGRAGAHMAKAKTSWRRISETSYPITTPDTL